ncbi:ROK family transcriptional regulator [Microlunatus elymi]|uniref:ROK family transcriptional regulator n=1 Tax=Microlunatus elymi TaxID=2596828 RepID=A0A516PZR1_9ACTN|nr:ROK family transcriptional regulator [Microlunatus elymi]QDP96632.1 ROK family transcriptional regulator [Microlunatus elymi]
MSTADSAAAAVRQANARDCLLQLRDASGPLTVGELAERTGLSRPTVDAVLADLVDRGPVYGCAPTDLNLPGRPARRFAFNARFALVAGVDVGARGVHCTLSDAGGALITSSDAAVPAGADRTQIVVDLVQRALRDADRYQDHQRRAGTDHDHLVHDQLPMSNGEPARLAAVGISVPAILDHDDQVVQSLNVGEWIGFDLRQELSNRLGCTVSIENDVKLAAYAEHRLGSGADNSIFVQIGNRISVAVIIDGKILQGSHRLAGELGSQRSMRWTRTSRDGQLVWSDGTQAVGVFRRAADGDDQAQQEIDAFCREIAPRLAALLLTIDPESVVIGGGLSRAGETLLDPLRRHVGDLLMTPDSPAFVAAALTTDGSLTGALGHAFEHGSSEIFGIPGVPAPWCRWRNNAQSTNEAEKRT